jgi:hypothetical protein
VVFNEVQNITTGNNISRKRLHREVIGIITLGFPAMVSEVLPVKTVATAVIKVGVSFS